METSSDYIDIATLKTLKPLCHLTEDELSILAVQGVIQHANIGDELVVLDADDARALYVLKGEVMLTAKDGRRYEVTGGTEKAKKSVSHLNPHVYTVTALTEVKYIWIDNQVLENVSGLQQESGEHVENIFLKDEVVENPLFQDIFRDLDQDRLSVPVLPDIIVRVRRLIREEADIKRLKIAVQTEPALTAMLMKVANSAIFHSYNEVTTVEGAIKRVGINTLQNFVMGFALRNVFKSKLKHLKKQMQTLWKHSTEVAAISYVLAKRVKGFDPDHAMLLGLLHDVGMLPILSYAERYPEIANNYDELRDTIRRLHGDVGGLILEKWHFPEDFITVAKEADDWDRDPGAEADYCDLVLVAQLLSFMGKKIEDDTPPLDGRTLPNLTDVPAYKKLGLESLSAENSIQILHDANEEIAEAMQLLAM